MMTTRLAPVLFVGLAVGACSGADDDSGCSSPAADFATLELTDCDGAALPLNYLSEHRAAWLFLYTGW